MVTEIKHRVIPEQAKDVRGDLSRLQSLIDACRTLGPGAEGPAVSSLQRGLRGLNLYSGKITGTYDDATTAAVKKLEAQGATGAAHADGVFDAAELKELRARQIFVKDDFKTPAHVGQKGTDVRELESKLKHLGYHPGKLDGVYDDKLEKAVKAYRKDEPKLSSKPSGAGHAVIAHLRGDVRHLEAQLKKLGRKPGRVDGTYSKRTARAVRAFQKKHGLEATGIANKATRAAIDKAASSGISDKTKKFISIAKAQQGDPYVFGAEGPDKFDCSGLIYYALNHAGVKAPRLTADGYKNLYADNKVSRKNLKPGDLVFLHYPNTRGIGPGHASHIEIYLGHGMTMGTDNPSEGARVEPIDWSAFIGGARVPGLQR